MIVGWIANVFLIVGLVLIGRKWKHAFVLTVVGEVLWTIESIRIGRPDMIFLCVVFAGLAGLNWWKWNREEDK